MAVENMLSFTVESVINCVHNERIVWDPAVNGSEEQKELAWHRIAECFGFATGGTVLSKQAKYDMTVTVTSTI